MDMHTSLAHGEFYFEVRPHPRALMDLSKVNLCLSMIPISRLINVHVHG